MTIYKHHLSTYVTHGDGWAGGMSRATGCLCPDGVRRNAYPNHGGHADSFFSVPAFVYVSRTRVYGSVSISSYDYVQDTPDGATPDTTTVRFTPYLYRKNWAKVCPVETGEVTA